MIFIIKGFWTIVFIFIVISTTFPPIRPPTFFGCLSNSGTFTELRTTSFIESTGVICSDSVSHNRVQVLSIPVLWLACSQDWTCKPLDDCLIRSVINNLFLPDFFFSSIIKSISMDIHYEIVIRFTLLFLYQILIPHSVRISPADVYLFANHLS